MSFAELKKREERAWATHAQFLPLWRDCFEHVTPLRRSAAATGQAQARMELCDNTAMVSAVRFAGRLQQDLFPPGQPWFALKPTALSEVLLAAKQLEDIRRLLGSVETVVRAVFQSAEFDTAIAEVCTDLVVGTGHLATLPGGPGRPVRFVSIPIEEMAIDLGPFNEIDGQFWRTRMTRRQLLRQYPKGTYPDGFASDAEAEETVHQCWTGRPDGRVDFTLFLDKSEAPVATEKLRSRRVATLRYWRVPGEAYGRGVGLLALPNAKTANKAKELTLRAAGLALLGLWGYRAGNVNPDVMPLEPGAWWPMHSTGGALGPDVVRLDMSSSRLDVGELIKRDERMAIQDAMNDQALPQEGATPRSATEVQARLRQSQSLYLGAFGRLMHEITPVTVQAVIDILSGSGELKAALAAAAPAGADEPPTRIAVQTLLTKVEVTSPMALVLKARRHDSVLNVAQLIGQFMGPQALDWYIETDKWLPALVEDMGTPADWRVDAGTRNSRREAFQKAQQQQAAAEAAGRAAPALKAVADVAAAEREQTP